MQDADNAGTAAAVGQMNTAVVVKTLD